MAALHSHEGLLSQGAPESLDALEGAHLLTHRAYQIETLPPEAMEGVQASVHAGDTPDTALGWGVGPQASPAPSAGCALLPARLALTRAICLHYAGLFGEVSNGGLSCLRGGLIYWQTCFEAPVMVAVLQITVRRMAGPPPYKGGFPFLGLGEPSLGGSGASRAFELCTAAPFISLHHPVHFY